MEALIRAHTALLLKEARRHVRSAAAKVPVEDVAREAELVLLEAGKRGLRETDVASPAAVVRTATQHAAGRVKRRRTLIEQVAAGDDLEAMSRDLAAVDADVPALAGALTPAQRDAQAKLDALLRALPPHDALAIALLYQDDYPLEDVAQMLSRPMSELAQARERILFTARETGIPPEPDRRGTAPPPAPGQMPGMTEMEIALRKLASHAAPLRVDEGHVEEALLRLLRDGDTSDDIDDAAAHVASCVVCRAILTEGEVTRRSVVVMAIEAPKGSTHELERAAADARARLFERGAGRWTAVVDSSRAESLKQGLEREEQSVVTRLAASAPIEVPLPADPASRRNPSPSLTDLSPETGTSAAEVQAWASVSRERRRPVEAPHLGWTAFAVAAVAAAIAIAIFAATR